MPAKTLLETDDNRLATDHRFSACCLVKEIYAMQTYFLTDPQISLNKGPVNSSECPYLTVHLVNFELALEAVV